MADQPQTPVVHVTTQAADGTTVFLDPAAFPDGQVSGKIQMSPVASLFVLWSSPSTFSAEKSQDIEHHKSILSTHPQIPFFQTQEHTAASLTYIGPTETVTRGFMHQTRSLDYLFMHEGELELELDGGEKRIVKAGEVVIQREAWHRWTNLSTTKRAVMFAVALGAEGATLGGIEIRKD
jgi:quercetin dioxygenase-like cupin family protein